MKFIKKLMLAAVVLACSAANAVTNPVDYVNTLMGTDNDWALSTGNTVPIVATPWGMNQWIPRTGKMGDGWSYTYGARKIVGFTQSHRPSPWINDFGQVTLMPTTGDVRLHEERRASWYSHKAEVAKPYYYSVYLADYDVTTEMTTTDRCAYFQITYPESTQSHIVVDAHNQGSWIKVYPKENKVVGYDRNNVGGVTDNYHNYFVMVFDKPFDYQVWENNTIDFGKSELKGDHVGALLSFKTKRGEKVHAKVASSFISVEQAEENLKEIGNSTFDEVKAKSKARWNEVLGVIDVESDNIDQLRTFYSCSYRTVLFPHMMWEKTATGEIKHYSPFNGKIEKGYFYTGTGVWDTFRALFPLINLLYPSESAKMHESFLNAYLESGFYPEWSSPGHRGCMVGNNTASVMADLILKGLNTADAQKVYEGMLASANGVMKGCESSGRLGWEYYNKLGYVPYNVGIRENVARTLEYAYDDWCIYQTAKKLGRPQAEIDLYKKRSQNYRNVFDKETNLMRGKNEDGQFQTPFNPLKWGDAFTEGNSWHYSWSVFHDIQGLIDLMGGKKSFVGMLDKVFEVPPIFDDSYYGTVIHEIREMQIMNMGNYAHGNQPIQHMIYLYSYANEPWKAQYWVREVMNKLYFATPDGYCGDEDNGQTSAWYVFSAMGFYPVCPASDQYVLGTPLFKKMTLKLENGKKIEISAPATSDANRYVKKMTVNGKEWTHNYVEYNTLKNGATLKFDMDSKPNKQRGVKDSDDPYSFTRAGE